MYNLEALNLDVSLVWMCLNIFSNVERFLNIFHINSVVVSKFEMDLFIFSINSTIILC